MSVRDLDSYGVEIGRWCKPLWDDRRAYGRLDDTCPSTSGKHVLARSPNWQRTDHVRHPVSRLESAVSPLVIERSDYESEGRTFESFRARHSNQALTDHHRLKNKN
jgi:hypothetical protein